MLDELSPEREKEIIDKVAKLVVDNGIANLAGIITPAYDYGFVYAPNILTTTAMLELFPFSSLFGNLGTDFCVFLQSDPGGNMERIMDRVRELNEEKKREEAARRAAEGIKPRMSFWKKIRSSLPKKK